LVGTQSGLVSMAGFCVDSVELLIHFEDFFWTVTYLVWFQACAVK